MNSDPRGSLIRSKGSRRLALNACDACRQRKTKCDEAKPACSRCARLDLECSYVETLASQKSLSLNALAETLNRIDTKLDDLTLIVSHNNNHHTSSNERTLTQANLAATHAESADHGMVQNFSSLAWNSRGVSDELSLSQRHSTAPQYLLMWECSKLQLNDIEIQYPLALESASARIISSTDPPPLIAAGDLGMGWVSRLSWSQMRHLVQTYFTHFHPSCLVLDESNFYENILGVVLRRDFSADIETCVVLLVFALGSIVAHHSGHAEWGQPNTDHGQIDGENGIDDTGLGFFNLATDLFLQVEGTNWTSVQCLLLTGLFYSSKLRVFDAWRSINRACSSIIILVSLKASQEAQHCQLFWIAYLQESQLLAEFDFPPSGLGRFANSIPLPLVPNSEAHPEHQLYQFFFLALISMRKVLNRIMYHLYNQRFYDSWEHDVSPTPSIPHSPLNSLVAELDRQIEEWRACLPPGLEFPAYISTASSVSTGELVSPHTMQLRPTQERLRGHLIVRYFAAKSILYRPFLHRILHRNRDEAVNAMDVEKARTAVDAALNSVLNSGLRQEPLTLLLHPINSLRSLFALEIQIAFILASGEASRAILPYNWELAEQIRARVGPEIIKSSATASRDYELLKALV